MNKHYGINARPIAGTAAYCVRSEPSSAILFASEIDGYLVPTDNGFHCWIETDDWVVDFTAPLFPLIVKEKGLPNPGPSMMQRRIDSAKSSPNDVNKAGDFYVGPDRDFTVATMKRFAERPLHQDLIDICLRWFVRPPKLMQSEIALANESGEMTLISFSRYQVIGTW